MWGTRGPNSGACSYFDQNHTNACCYGYCVLLFGGRVYLTGRWGLRCTPTSSSDSRWTCVEPGSNTSRTKVQTEPKPGFQASLRRTIKTHRIGPEFPVRSHQWLLAGSTRPQRVPWGPKQAKPHHFCHARQYPYQGTAPKKPGPHCMGWDLRKVKGLVAGEGGGGGGGGPPCYLDPRAGGGGPANPPPAEP